MAAVITCPSCGKLSFMPDHMAGKIARCTGCGGKVKVPAPTPAEAPVAAVEQETSGATGDMEMTSAAVAPPPPRASIAAPVTSPDAAICAVCGESFDRSEVSEREDGQFICTRCSTDSTDLANLAAVTHQSQRARHRRKKRSATTGIVTGVVIAACIAVGAIYWVMSREQRGSPLADWESQNRAQILSMKQNADALAASDPDKSFAAYDALFDFVGSRGLKDPTIIQTMKDASDARLKVAAVIAANRKPTPAAEDPDAPQPPDGDPGNVFNNITQAQPPAIDPTPQVQPDPPETPSTPVTPPKPSPPSADRSTALAGAVRELRQKGDAVKPIATLTAYLKSHPDDTDSSVLDVLGTALSRAAEDEAARKSPAFSEAVEVYEATNEKLEETRPGQRRWGPRWLPAHEVDAKIQQMADAQAAYNKLLSEANTVGKEVKDAEEKLTEERRKAFLGGTANVAAAKSKLDAVQKTYDEKKKIANDAKAKIPRPQWLTDDELGRVSSN